MPEPTVPAPRPDEALLDEMLSLWQRERRRGRDVPAAEVCRDRPELAPELERRIRALVGLERLARDGDPTRTSPSAAEGTEPSAAVGPEAVAYPFLTPAERPDELGRLGPYRVLKLLGSGGMGLVFQAEDDQLCRPVALKVMRPELAAGDTARQRFLREARSAAAVRHDHITTIYQVGEDRGVPFLAMELLEGQTLEQRLHDGKPLLVAEALRVGREVAEGLAVAHGRGLIHRDIKPANIWLEGPSGRVKILDFGLARRADGEGGLTEQGAVLGTPSYMAPEQASGEAVDQRCDLFSLGCVLYRMLTGRPPFSGRSLLEVLRSVAVEAPPSPRRLNPAVPPALADLTTRLLAKAPADRPPSAAAVAEALAAIERAEAGRRPTGRRRLPRTLAALLLLVAAGVGGVLFGPAVYRFTTNQGEVVIETEDPDVEVTVRGPDIRILDTKTNQAVTLRAGKYHVELSGGKEGLRLSTREFTLERAGKQIVKVLLPEAVPQPAKDRPAVPARWEPGPADDSLTGLAPRPARLPGVRRWQVTTIAPGGATKVVAWSPDGRWLVCGGLEPFLRVYERATGRLVKILAGHGPEGAWTVAWSPDGKQIASGGRDKTLRLWDADEGTCRRVIHADMMADVSSVAWSPDGRRLAAAGGTGMVGIWRTADGSPGPLFKAHEPRGIGGPIAMAVSWSPDGAWLASGGADGLRLWDGETGKPGRDPQPESPQPVLRVAWSPDGRRIAGVSPRKVWLWDVKTAQAGPSFATQAYDPRIAWGPDGKRLVLGNLNSVETWEGADGSPPRQLTPLEAPEALSWSPDGRWIALAGAGRVLRLWDAAEGKLGPAIQEPGDRLLSVSWSADGVRLATGDAGGAVRIWDGGGGEPGPIHQERGRVLSVAWRPDGKQLAFTGDLVDLQLWPGARGEAPVQFAKDVRGHGLAWSPDGRRLAVRDQSVSLWDVAGRRPEATLKVKAYPYGVAWRPDGGQVATSSDSGVQLWNAADGGGGQILKDTASCSGVAWSRDGTHLAGTGWGGLRIYDMTRGGSTWQQGPGMAVAWSPRQDTLAYTDLFGRMGFCDAEGKGRREFPAHHDVYNALSWDPSGLRLASCSIDGTLRVWDAPEGRPLWQAVLLPGGKTATFSAAGELLRADAGAEQHLVYLVERTAGKVELLTAEEFKQLLAANPPGRP